MPITIEKFRNIALNGNFERVKASGGEIIQGTKPFAFNLISKTIGMITGQRAEHNRETYEAFKQALSGAYGEAGIKSLTAHRPETESNRAISTDLIQNVIVQAETDFRMGKVTEGPKAAVSSMRDYLALTPLASLAPGSIMIKKAFSASQRGGLDDHKRGVLDWVITRGQKAWGALFSDKGSSIDGTIDGERHRTKTRFLGHSSSEHAGIALDSKHIGEAIGGGLRTNDTTMDTDVARLRDTKYVVYEPVPELRLKMAEIANRFCETDGARNDGNYSASGAFTSLFKSRVNSQYETDMRGNVKFDESGKAIVASERANTLQAARAFLSGNSDVRPDVFCSEFAALVLELAMEELKGHGASGQDPNAISPMHLEDLVNSRPDLFTSRGRYEGQNAG